EILNPIMGQDEEGTLLAVLDKTVTPMGGRLIRQLITHPLVRLEPVKQRLDRVEAFFSDNHRREEVRDQLGEISDLERLLGRISTGRASPRDLNSLRRALAGIAPLRETLGAWDVPALRDYRDNLRDMDQVVALIEQAIDENPPLNLTEGGIIREGYHPPLDELRQISREGKDWMLNLQSEEREKSNIPSLKIGYNKVFGYYFEVTRAHSAKVPDYFIRKQTLVNAERYITPALKEYEEKVLGAEEKMGEMEYQLFQEIRDTVAGHGKDIQNNARLIAELDCWAALAEAAVMYKYARPEVDEGEEIVIEGGRHPVVERLLPPDESFIENDTALGNRDTQIMLITGPNMSGKSTYLRQVGLIVLLAQIGSFVPAERARIGLTDRIYTRVGASDNLAFGESTFMVEMLEAANILNNATPQSLILLDEVGRGTSTYDGLSIAWAMTEYLHHHKRVAAKTLFATHYHELTRLEGMHPRVKNYRVAVREYEDHVVFLRKIERGGMDNSYGIYVAQMAGLPAAVIERAREVLRSLEGEEAAGARKGDLRGISGMTGKEQQLSLFEPPRPSVVEGELRKLDPDHLTPIEALLKLQELKKMLE
ncbi:MAG TPA: DNA mismatch repair protein MutS, partial [Calditrichia bacterium]|nr:DNA mismatch repair protein MutS [Calditrichia bacterium]